VPTIVIRSSSASAGKTAGKISSLTAAAVRVRLCRPAISAGTGLAAMANRRTGPEPIRMFMLHSLPYTRNLE
jgi:hypothetical protein